MTIAEATLPDAFSRASQNRTRPGGAVIVGGDYKGLGIVQSLGRHHIPVCVIDDEYSIARFSRYATYSVRVKDLRNEKQAIDAIVETGRRLHLDGWALYPTRDETVAAIARHRPELTQFFCVPTPGWRTIQWIWDKRNTYYLAQQLGIPTPRTWYPRTAEDLDCIDKDPPYAVKPAIKEHFFYATRVKAWRADTRDELRELFLRASQQLSPGEVMIQDLIPGDGTTQFAYCAFYKDGQAIGSMLTRRTRQHPREFGRASTFVETVDLPAVEDTSERFLKAIDYYGLVEIEYKFDSRDGQYKLLDVNARTWGYHTLGAGAGVDFPYLLFADLSGQSVAACRARTGITWVRLLTDLPMAMLDILHGHQKPRDYFRSVIKADVEAVFTKDDPAPGFAELVLLPYLSTKRAL